MPLTDDEKMYLLFMAEADKLSYSANSYWVDDKP
jgi:hypothetical protein